MKNEGVHQQNQWSIAEENSKLDQFICEDNDLLSCAQIYKSCFLASKI